MEFIKRWIKETAVFLLLAGLVIGYAFLIHSLKPYPIAQIALFSVFVLSLTAMLALDNKENL